MIDEEITYKEKGYRSTDLSPKSNNKVWAVCEGENCEREGGRGRWVRKSQYRDLCLWCSRQTDEYRMAVSESWKTRSPVSDEAKHNMSEAQNGRVHPDETKYKISESHKGMRMPDDAKRKLSAWHQGIDVDDWTRFVSNGAYCEKFDNVCKERNREKYGRMCFLCGKSEKDNGENLCVHHVDMNKSQGCDEHEWKLVPLCRSCHSKAHNETWKSRIEYLLMAHDEAAHVFAKHGISIELVTVGEMLE